MIEAETDYEEAKATAKARDLSVVRRRPRRLEINCGQPIGNAGEDECDGGGRRGGQGV